MNTLKVVIVDDEMLARERLKRMLAADPTVEILQECTDGRAAIEAIRARKPDLVFLDVQMPEIDGFGVIEALEESELPGVIFCTAHDSFALKAFEVRAIDYLLKPFDPERLADAVSRARRALSLADTSARQGQMKQMIAEMRPAPPPPERISVKSGGKIVLIKPEEIDWVEADDNYVTLHVGKASHMIRETMNAMEARLQNLKFLRISRSTIVNVQRVKEIHPLFHGDYTLVLNDGTKLSASRNYRDRLRQVFTV